MNYLILDFKFIVLLIFIFYFIFYKSFNDKTIPKISIFLPIYNKERYLNRSINSIQNQSLKEVEIIAINDYSTDKTLEILKELQKYDKRIKIINNKKNYGLLYSRSMGIQNSRGEYIMNLDPDDELAGNDNLEYLYNKAKKNNVEVLSYSFLYKSNNSTVIKCSNFDKILIQPEIFESAFNSNNILNDYLIWNKLIKRSLFIKVHRLFRQKNKTERWNFHEDNIWSLLINKYSRSMLCTNKLIYIYYSNEESFMNNRGNIQEINNLFNRHYMFTEILNKKKEEKYIIAEISELIYLIDSFFLSIIKNNPIIKEKLINLISTSIKKYEIPYNYFIKFKCFIDNLMK